MFGVKIQSCLWLDRIMSAQRGILNASRIKRRAAVNRTAGLQPVKPQRLPSLPYSPSQVQSTPPCFQLCFN